MKKIISVLFLTCLETIVFILLHDYVFTDSFLPTSYSVSYWGVSLQIALLEFIILSIILNAFLISYNDIKPFWPILTTIILYSFTWINDLAQTPLPALKLLACVCAGFFSYYFFSVMLRSITRKVNWMHSEN